MYKLIIAISIFVLGPFSSFAQSTTARTTRISLEYFKNHDNTQRLVATLIVREKRYVPLADVMIQFYSVNDTSKVLLEKIRTNAAGEATFFIQDFRKIYADSSGAMTFEVEFIGDKSSKRARREVTIKPANLELSFSQKDSTKSIEVVANEIAGDDLIIPIKGVTISLYVQGTFSLLNIGREKTNENGRVNVDFPTDIPGDTKGLLTIVTKIEESDDYGTLEARGEINWGKPIPPVVEKNRGLGDTDAPLWMVYTLIVLLSAVWFHYLYVLFMIVKIKWEENKQVQTLSPNEDM